MTSRNQMRKDLYNIITEVLCVWRDLGGESIDFLDLSFRCEKLYGVRVEFQQAVPPDKVPADANGMITAEGIAFLKSRFPFLDLTEFAKNPQVSRVLELLTVEVIAQFLFETIEAHEQSLPKLPAQRQAANPM